LKTIVSDTSKLAEISILEKAVVENGEKLDVLFLNAGIAVFTPIEQVTEADFDAQFNTNVKGHFFTLQKLIPHLANGAAVVFTSSTVATASNLGASVYSATKGALNKIAQIAANELADRKIRVNIVSPGPVSNSRIGKCSACGKQNHIWLQLQHCKDWVIRMRLRKRYCSCHLTLQALSPGRK
jgi:NAD(P)-dependent dehydrogenase (short-subunit alcohol dehydrogenase family)